MDDNITTNNGKEPERVIFPQGLVGLEGYHNFTINQLPDQELFMFLKSSDDKNFGLVITNPFWFVSDYEFELPDRYIRELGDGQEFQVFVTVTLAPKPEDITVNLVGPLVINRATGRGVQVVLENKKYTTKYKLMQARPAGG